MVWRVSLLVVISALHLMAAARAAACWCRPSPNARVVWPEDGALDVTWDTAIVLWRHYGSGGDGEPDRVSLSLTGPDGEPLELEETRHSSYVWQCSGETVFYQPKQPLEEGGGYVLNTRAGGSTHMTKFSVSATPRKLASALDPKVTYTSVKGDASHQYCGADCADLAEIRVDMGRVPETPVWLFVHGAAGHWQHNEWKFGPEFLMDVADGEPDPRRLAHVSVRAPSDDPCVDIGIYGVDGRPLFEERRCQPDRCVVYGNRATNSCNTPPQFWFEASRISEDSCEAPPRLRDSDLAPLTYGPDLTHTARASGCSSQPSATHGAWPLALGLCAWLLVRRRRV